MSPSATTTDLAKTVRYIPLPYDASDSEESARKLVVALNPEWGQSEGTIEFDKFKDGITNTLFKAVKRRPGRDQHQIDEEAVLLRAYGDGTQVLIDRDREAQSHSLLSKNDLAPPLFARFDNGLLYKYIEGEPCSPDDLQRADVWPAIAGVLGRWHAVLPTESATANSSDNDDPQYDLVKRLIPDKPLPHLWSVMQKWINVLPTKTEEQRMRNQALQAALEESAKRLGKTSGLSHGAYIMSHCDLLSGNVIIRPGKDKSSDGQETAPVSFIDYEYTTPAPAAFDLANHFAEYVGFDCDMNKIPSEPRRRAFIKEYVSAYRQNETAPSQTNGHANGTNGQSKPFLDDDVDQLMQEVNDFRGLPGLYWGIWALIQAMISSIDFDYVTYADDRLGEYWAWQGESDGSRAEEDKEMPLRERRWASQQDP